MANQWFRMYGEFINDPKVQMISETDQRRYIMLLCIKCNGDVTLHDEQVAFQLRISNEEWLKTKAVLVSKNLIDNDNNPTNWDKRQFVSDSSNERVKRHREKMKQECNVTVTPPDTDTDTDTDIKKNNTKKTKSNNKKFNPLLAKPENVSVETWSMWVKYRSEIKKPLTETMCKQQAVDLVNCPNPDDVIKKSIACGWQGLFPNPKNNIRQFPDRKPSMQANVSDFNFEVGPNGEVKF